MNRTRVGLIGIGDIAQKVYLPLLAARADVELASVMSRTQATVEEVCGTYRIPYGTTRLEELLEQGLDAVFIHSPTEAHYDQAMACLARGIAVYVDKPLSYDIRESEQMAAYAEQKGLLLAVGFNRRFAPLYAEAKQWLSEAGGFESCSVLKHRIKLQKHDAKSTLYDDLIHMLDMLLWLGGDDYELVGRTMRTDSTGKLLHAGGMLAFASGGIAGEGATGTYGMIRMAGVDLEKLELHGNGRSAEVVNMEQAWLYRQRSNPQLRSFGSWDTILARRGFAGAVDHFLACVSTPEYCKIRADLVLPVHRLVERLAVD